jgi:hypothetical protein
VWERTDRALFYISFLQKCLKCARCTPYNKPPLKETAFQFLERKPWPFGYKEIGWKDFFFFFYSHPTEPIRARSEFVKVEESMSATSDRQMQSEQLSICKMND